MKPPNIVFIMSDDHASHAMSCYGSRINKTPNLDRIADNGIRFDNCFCTNSICTPSRAAILTGTYNHVNKVTTLRTPMDNRLETLPKILQNNGYQTAIFGKWHLGTGISHCPAGFDDWAVLPGQGFYFNPVFIFKGPDGGIKKTVSGYATDIITNMTVDWIKQRDREKPFCVFCHHKAPHRPWYPDEKHAGMFLDEDIPEPDTLYDDYLGRASAAARATMRLGVHMRENDIKCEIPEGLPEMDARKWAYQRYIKDYLRVVASVDDNVGRLLDCLEEEGVGQNTIVIYTSDQGFFLGDHGWYDKRFMYEESLRMPFILQYPDEAEPGSISKDIILNVDFAPFLIDIAGIKTPSRMQGRSFAPIIRGAAPGNWRKEMYYRYWMHNSDHNVTEHYGIRTARYKLICYRSETGEQDSGVSQNRRLEWELFDLEKDPCEMRNLFNRSEYSGIAAELRRTLHRLQDELGDARYPEDRD